MKEISGNNALRMFNDEFDGHFCNSNAYRPNYRYLKLDNLAIAKYQRKLRHEDCEEYLKEFDWRMVGVLLISYRDGKYYIVDGQHRQVLLQMQGVEETLCQIITGLTYEEEATLFKKFNTKRKSLGRADLFISDYESKDVRIKNIARIMLFYGYYINRMNETCDTENCIRVNAVEAVESAYDSLGKDQFDFMFSTIKETWGEDKAAVKRMMITGVTRFFKKFPTREINKSHFVKRLSRLSPASIMFQANADLKYMPSNSEKPEAVARIIWKAYNRKLPKTIRALPNEF